MSDERDPRINPVAGDVTHFPEGAIYTIRRVVNGDVHYTSSEGEQDFIPVEVWREVAAQDEIIRRGDA